MTQGRRPCLLGVAYSSRREVEIVIGWTIADFKPELCHSCFHWHVARTPKVMPVRDDFVPLVEKLGY